MKKNVCIAALSLMTILGFGQQFYPFKKNDVTYFGLNPLPEMFLNHLGIYYTSPDDRLLCLDSLSKKYMEHFNWKEDKILMSFEKHKQQNTDTGFTLHVDITRVIMSEKKFFLDNVWNDELSRNTMEMIGNMGFLIIGMKEWPIPQNTKPFTDDFYGTLDLTPFKSIIIIESYFPSHRQVSTSLFFRNQQGELILGGSSLGNILSTYAKKTE